MLFISSASSFPRLRSPDGAAVVCQLHRTFTIRILNPPKNIILALTWHLKDGENLLFAAVVLARPLSRKGRAPQPGRGLRAGRVDVAGTAAPQPATAAQRQRLRAAGRGGGGGGLGAHHVHGEFHQGDAGMKQGLLAMSHDLGI